MSTKRLITPIPLPGAIPGVPPTKMPEITWIDPKELLVDESYQRGVGEKGQRLIRRIVEGFDWRRFKPPTAVWTDEGLEVVDGQHSAIAAACHPAIESIPVVVVEASQLADRASAFIGINRDRLNVTMMQIHAASITAGEPSALEIEGICRHVGVRILKTSPSNGAYQPRDTVAVRAISSLVHRRGVERATEVMKTIAEADLAPITVAAIRAADFLFHDSEHADTFDPPELTKAIATLGPLAEVNAGLAALEHKVPKWRGLAAVWFRKTRKRRIRAEGDVGGSDAPSEPAPSGALGCVVPFRGPIVQRLAGARVIDRRRHGAVNLGDPAPGRSALDQRQAEALRA